MYQSPTVSNLRPWAAVLAVGAALVAVLVALVYPHPAAAAPATGSVDLTIAKRSKAGKTLDGVKVSAKAPATSSGGKLSFPVSDAEGAPPTAVTLQGALTFKSGKRTAKVKGLSLTTSGGKSQLSGTIGKNTLTLLVANGSPVQTELLKYAFDGAAAKLKGSAAKAISKKLKLEGKDRVRGGDLGDVSGSVTLPGTTPPVIPPVDPPPPTEPYPYEAECPVAPATGNPGFGGVPGTITSIAPSPTFDVGQDVTGTSIQWGFKSSFRTYVLVVPPAGSVQSLDGATNSAPGLGMAAGSAYVDYPVDEGTYESGNETDHSDDKLVAEGSGTTLFCKPGHGFNVAMQNPTVTFDGDGDARITADVGLNLNGTWYPYQRADIAELDLTGVQPTITNSGNTLTWDDVPATMTADGEDAFGGIYSEGDALDPVTVSTTLDRPLESQCTIASGNAAPTQAVNFTLDPQPTLTSPVNGTSGTINWGFRRSSRATVANGGSFQLLGGATEGYPGNMGGGNTAPPTGGQNKFFRFPISEYSYDAGTASATDDRLIASSDATVGFCGNPTFGNFGFIISKPTLVIDGANSQLTANVYSFQGPFGMDGGKGWIGGRVELVDLDASAVNAVTSTGTVTWGDVVPDNTPLVNGIPVTGALKTNALAVAALTPASTATGWDPVAVQINTP